MKNVSYHLPVTLCVLFLSALLTSAETIVLQPGNEGKDAYVCDCLPNVNNPNGSIVHLYQGQYGACFDRTLIRWDLSTLPENITITGAIMELKCNSVYGSLTNKGQMLYYRITSDWQETGVTYATLPSCSSTDSVVTDWPVAGQWHAVDITQFVQMWVVDPNTNFGIYAHCSGTKGQCCCEYSSSDVSTADNRPKLTITYTPSSEIKKCATILPGGFELEQNYPNPFNPMTTIPYSIPGKDFVSVKIYNLEGKEVAILVNEIQECGSYEIHFDASHLPSGIYYFKLSVGTLCSVKKLLLIK